MLVLSRREGESILLKDQAGNLLGQIDVVQITPGRVRLGFEMPKEIMIERSEIQFDPWRKREN